MTQRISIYLNVTLHQRGMDLTPAIFGRRGENRYLPGDVVALAHAYADVTSSSVEQALSMASMIGNVDPAAVTGDERDLVNGYRSERVRSLCVGDIVAVDGDAWQLSSVGFAHIGPEAGLNTAGGRHPRDLQEVIDAIETSLPGVDADERSFVMSLIRPAA